MSSVQSRVTDFFQLKKSNNLADNSKGESSKGSGEKSESYTPVSPSKLNAKDVRKRLGKVRNLSELRQKLGSFSDAAARLNKEREETQLQVQAIERAALESSPVKSQKSTSATLQPEEQKLRTPEEEHPIIPAYERYAHLVSVNTKLELPVKFQTLLETFRASDQIVSIMYNRNEVITFDRLKAGIQQMTRKNFEISHLGQLKSVYNEAYQFEQIKLTSKFSNESSNVAKYCLVLQPNIETDLCNYNIKSPTKTPVKRRLILGDDDATPPGTPLKISPFKSPCWTPCSPSKQGAIHSKAKPLTGARLICRTEIFRKNLHKMVIKEHRKFLATLNPPIVMSAFEESQLKRWYPEFPLNNIFDIKPAELPLAPVTEKIFSAKEMLQKTTTNPRLPARIEEALKAAAAKDEKKDENVKTTTIQKTMKEKCLAGIPAGVLEKIRAKESARLQKMMHRNPEEEQKFLRLRRLPDMVRIVKGIYATENKNVMPYALVCRKLADSYSKSSISATDIELHLDQLIKLAPNWLVKTQLQNKGSYLRMDKKICSDDIFKKIDRQISLIS